MAYKVVISKRASLKLEKLFNYIESKWSEKVRKEVAKKIDDAIIVIQSNPSSFPQSYIKKGLH